MRTAQLLWILLTIRVIFSSWDRCSFKIQENVPGLASNWIFADVVMSKTNTITRPAKLLNPKMDESSPSAQKIMIARVLYYITIALANEDCKLLIYVAA